MPLNRVTHRVSRPAGWGKDRPVCGTRHSLTIEVDVEHRLVCPSVYRACVASSCRGLSDICCGMSSCFMVSPSRRRV